MPINPNLRKILRDYNYLYESLQDVKEISSVAEGEFRTAMINSGDKEALQALIPNESQTQKLKEIVEETEKEIEENHNDKEFKKIFRKIAIMCHPDKNIGADESKIAFLKDCYEQANFANKNYDWGLLLRIAGSLGMDDIELTPEQIENIKKKNQELSNEIQKYEGSMAFQWYTKNDEMAREKFLAICLGVFKNSLKKD